MSTRLQAPFVAGFWKDPAAFQAACSAATARGFRRHDALCPWPLHGLEARLGIKRSWLGRAVFAALLTGALAGFFMQYWMMRVDWPINVGGKPFNSWPQWVVIVFESGILLGAFTTFFLSLGLAAELIPNPASKVLRRACTDDTFALAIPIAGNAPAEEIQAFLLEQGAKSVGTYDTEDQEQAGEDLHREVLAEQEGRVDA